MTRSATDVFLLSENRLLRETLARLLQKRADISVVGVSRATQSVIEEIVRSNCEIVLTDRLSPARDANLLEALVQHVPEIKIVLFGMDEDAGIFLKSTYFGVSGYLLKEASAAEIIHAVRAVAQGEAALPPRLCMTLVRHLAQQARGKPKIADCQRPDRYLTQRQLELVNLVAKGLTNKEIAANLHLSEFTVKNHIRRIMRQVDAGDRHEAVEMVRASAFLPAT